MKVTSRTLQNKGDAPKMSPSRTDAGLENQNNEPSLAASIARLIPPVTRSHNERAAGISVLRLK
jgi:hypothetical protein